MLMLAWLFLGSGLASAAVYQPNLVVNGDFSDGNTGFFTEYTYVGDGGSMVPEGTYTVANDPHDFHNDFTGAPYLGDYFLIVNGADESGKIVWQQDVPVEPGKEYMFSMMVSSLVTAAPADLEITIYINGVAHDQIVVAPNETNVWKNFTWFSDEDKSGHNVAEITIVETSDIAYGNDFGIDDIQFKELVTCAYSQGYWFAKPGGVVWPYNVELGGKEYTQAEGAAFWPPASAVNSAFTQYAAIYLSGITLEKFDDEYGLAYYMDVIDQYFAENNGITENELSEAAGFIGEWISANHCLDCSMEINISVVDVSCFGGNDGRILVEMDGAAPFNICKYTGCIPEVMDPQFEKTQTGQYNNLSAGTYYIVVVDSNGCLFTQCVTVTEPEQLVVEEPVVTEVQCFGGADGTATLTVSGGTPPYTVNGVAFDGPEYTFTGLSADDYAFEVYDANECGPVPVAFKIEQPLAALEAEVKTIVEPTCNGDSDGTALIQISGGTAPYFYDEVELEGDELLLTGLAEGDHEALILDANGCEVLVTVVMTEPEPLALEIAVTNVSCFEGEDGTISVNASGGTGPYTYCLLNDCDGDCIGINDAKTEAYDVVYDGHLAGDYCIMVTDANGCTISQKVTITEPDKLVASVEVINHVSCFGLADGKAALTITGGNTPYDVDFDYDWDALEAGVYTVIVDDYKGCGPVEVEFTITEPDKLVATVDVLSDASCFGESDGVAELTIAGGTKPYDVDFGEYDWDALAAGDYKVVVTDANGCVAEDTFTITQPEEILIEVEVTDVTCNGGSDGNIAVNVTAEFEIAQICFFDECIVPDGCDPVVPTKTLPDTEFGGLQAGWYTIVVMDVNGCIAYVCVEIKEPDPIAVALTYAPILCFDGTTDILVEGEGGTGDLTLYAVDGDDLIPVGVLPVTVPDVSGGAALNWVVVDENLCEFPITDFIAQPEELVIVDVDPTAVTCFEGNDGMVAITIDGGTPPYTANMGTVVGDVLTISDLMAGVYTVEILDANNCWVDQIFTILDGPEIFVNLVEVIDVMCHGSATGSLEVLATGGNGGFTYSIDGDVYQESGLFEDLLAGEYTVYVMDAEGCTSMLEGIVVAEPEDLVVTLEVDDVSCFGAADGQVSGYITGGVGPYYTCLYTFCVDDPENTDSTPDKSQGFVHYDLEPGEYTLLVMDQNGCKWYQCITIGEPVAMEATITAYTDVAVYGEATGEATVTATGGSEVYTYLWSDGQTTQTATGLVAGDYSVVVTDENGCEAFAEVTISQPGETSSSPLSDGNLETGGDQIALRAYPNPFNSETTIEFELKESAHVTLEVYNIVGEKVAELFEGHVDAFVPHKVTLKAGSMPNGIYFYRLNNGNNTFFNKVVLSR
ncbi:MAG: T9SS type A sorting domain-containing protein [Bacteroidales bacterium]